MFSNCYIYDLFFQTVLCDRVCEWRRLDVSHAETKEVTWGACSLLLGRNLPGSQFSPWKRFLHLFNDWVLELCFTKLDGKLPQLSLPLHACRHMRPEDSTVNCKKIYLLSVICNRVYEVVFLFCSQALCTEIWNWTMCYWTTKVTSNWLTTACVR